MTGHFDGSKLNEMTIFQKMTLKIHCILSTNFHTPSYFGQSLKVNGLRTESRPSLNCQIELITNLSFVTKYRLLSAQERILPGCEGQF